MRKRNTAVLGVVSGVLCALAIFAFTQSIQARMDGERAAALQRYGGEQVEACVATRDIAPGETVSNANTSTKLWLADLLPSESISNPSEVLGKQATSLIVSGEVLTSRRFAQSASAIDVPEGMYAVSVPVEEVGAVGGAVRSGMKVDVYLTGTSGTSLLSQSTLVLATSKGDSESASSKKVSWITLAVKPETVQEFVTAAEKGSLYFAIPGEDKGE